MAERVLVSVLRFDEASEELISSASAAVRLSCGIESREQMHPHVSLIPTDATNDLLVIEQLATLVSKQSRLMVKFSHLGWFQPGVLFVGVTPTAELVEFHRRTYELSAPSSSAKWIDLYQPDAWVPHCTLAVGLSEADVGQAVASVSQHLQLPITARCRTVELIEVGKARIRTLEVFPMAS